jgi:hypothetical protein
MATKNSNVGVGNCNLPYVWQDINVVIEHYHANLKATLWSSKGRFHGRCVDWVINELVGDVLLHYWYKSLRKNHGFVLNKKQENFVINVFLMARMIPNARVTLPTNNFGMALVTSKKRLHKKC